MYKGGATTYFPRSPPSGFADKAASVSGSGGQISFPSLIAFRHRRQGYFGQWVRRTNLLPSLTAFRLSRQGYFGQWLRNINLPPSKRLNIIVSCSVSFSVLTFISLCIRCLNSILYLPIIKIQDKKRKHPFLSWGLYKSIRVSMYT